MASANSTLLYLALAVLLLPLLSFVLLSFLGKKLPRKGDWLSALFTGLSFAAALKLAIDSFRPGAPENFRQFGVEWLRIGATRVEASIYLDNLSLLMLVLVSFISLLVHVYSMFYMKDDARYHRYWPYLSLFIFAMLGLVASGNLLLTYMCWELVGLASYLMIGFWFERPAAAAASLKAFVMNRVGDLGFLVALMVLFSLFGSFDIAVLRGALAEDSGGGLLYLAAAGLALAAFAKSAQFPLQSWLPDAMEGPTSVSSLIHAATMVAAGVFLLARVFFLFPEELLNVIACIGAFTSLLGASAAAVQYDIKKVLAYSTISQLGFMILGVGTGNFQAALFHLFTHAFFKCLLFLGAGSVIHHIHEMRYRHGLEPGEQDMRLMGGLRRHMPFTFWMYTLAGAALAGLPFFSGFLSKEMLLLGSLDWAAERGGAYWLAPALALCSSLLTAWYIGRQWSMVFMGKPRTPQVSGIREHNLNMILPMAILGLFTLFIWFSANPFSTSAIALIRALPGPAPALHEGVAVWALLLMAVLLIPALLFAAYRKYSVVPALAQHGEGAMPRTAAPNAAHPPTAPDAAAHAPAAHDAGLAHNAEGPRGAEEASLFRDFLASGWYVDRLYNAIFVKPVLGLGRAAQWIDQKLVDGFVHLLSGLSLRLSKLVAWIDRNVVDGLVNYLAARARSLGDFFRGFQTGRVQQYMALAVLALLVLYIIKLLFDK